MTEIFLVFMSFFWGVFSVVAWLPVEAKWHESAIAATASVAFAALAVFA